MNRFNAVICGIALCVALLGASTDAAELMISDPVIPQPFAVGDVFWFDILISDAMGEHSEGAQVRLAVAGPGPLAFSAPVSDDVTTDPDYWIFGNSTGAIAQDLGAGVYQFLDGPDNPSVADLVDGEIIARFAFEWGGIEGDYTVTVDTAIDNTVLVQDFAPAEPAWFMNPMTMHIPEPGALALLGLGGVAFACRRSRR